MSIILWKRMPRWYGLSWDPKDVAIRILLHRDIPLPQEALERFREKVLRWRWEERHRFRTFDTDPASGQFGLDGALRVIHDSSADHVEFVGKLPKVRVRSRLTCNLCGGKKTDAAGESCFGCNGSGNAFVERWKRADALALSIDFLLNPLAYNEAETPSLLPQLLTLYFIAGDMKGVGGTVSGAFHHWARRYPRYTSFPDVEEAMKRAYDHMMGGTYARINRFRATLYSKENHFSLDQFRCGLCGGPDDDPGETNGYDFHSKDVVHSVDQLVFLVGLAALHDRADREIKEQTKTA